MSGILLGLGQLAQPTALLALLGGVVIGLIVGSLPGLNDSITMAVLIPITFGMEPQVAICLLVGIYCASACGGSVPVRQRWNWILQVRGPVRSCPAGSSDNHHTQLP